MPTKPIAERFAPEFHRRVRAFLEEVSRGVKEQTGLDAGYPCDMSDDQYAWALTFPSTPALYDLRVELDEQAAAEGDGEGANVSARAVWEDGRVAHDCVPHNFSPEVWTTDLDELRRRLDAILDVEWWADAICEDLAAQHTAARSTPRTKELPHD